MVKLSGLKVNEEFAPKADPVFTHLLTEAVRGRQPVHFAIIALKLLRRFDVDHRPELSVSGKNILEQVIEMWPKGQPIPIWVYQSGDEFISSDDYFTFAAYEQKKLDRVPCFVFGTPVGEGVTGVQGPLTVEQIKMSLGFS